MADGSKPMTQPTVEPPVQHPVAGTLHRARWFVAVLVMTACLAALCWRLFVIQIVDHEKYSRSARRMRSSSETVPAYRGDAYSIDRVLLARDVVDFEIGVDPRFVSRDNLTVLVRLVCDAMGKSPEYRRDRLFTALDMLEAGGEYVRLAVGASQALVTEIEGAVERILSKKEMKGFIVEPLARRTYPRELLAGSVVGVTDSAGAGIEGIEKSLGPYLSRRDGYREVLKDALQKTRIFQVGNVDVAPVGGYDVYLTIQSTLQAIVEEELEAGVAREKAAGGLFLLMDCNTGDILALANYPSYDPNRFSEYPDQVRKERRTNKAVESLYEPGSVIKPFFASYALERGLCRREQSMMSLVASPVTWDGGRHAHVGRRLITDVHEHPGMTFEGAVVHSSNIGMSILGLKLGRQGIMDVLDRYGFNRPTGIDLPAEAKWSPWTPPMQWHPLYSPVSASFGYEVMVTPIQLCRAFAAVVNGGCLLKPRIVDRIERDGEVQRFPSRQVERQAISAETSHEMREILHLVVEEGTAKWLKIEGFEFGGKTGTSNMAKRAGYTKEDYLASFEGFAPVEKPEVVALCMIEKPRGGSIYGGMVAGPIVAEVFRRVFKVEKETKLTTLKRVARN